MCSACESERERESERRLGLRYKEEIFFDLQLKLKLGLTLTCLQLLFLKRSPTSLDSKTCSLRQTHTHALPGTARLLQALSRSKKPSSRALFLRSRTFFFTLRTLKEGWTTFHILRQKRRRIKKKTFEASHSGKGKSLPTGHAVTSAWKRQFRKFSFF